MYMCIYIYIYIVRERQRESERLAVAYCLAIRFSVLDVIVSPTGIGNVVGSALFNLLCIIGASSFSSSTAAYQIDRQKTIY